MSAPVSPDAAPAAFERLRDLAPKFDGFIVDQWGVLHDGTSPYPGAVECLRRLREGGGRVVILSNSGKVTAESVARMARIGFGPDAYDFMLTAGEDARQALLRRASFYRGLGDRCFAFKRDDDRGLIEGLGLTFVDRLEDADFILLIGVPEDHDLVRLYGERLRSAVELRLPLICANPDLTRVTENGLADAGGLLAQHYEELGGTVHYHGKPHPPIFRSALEALEGIAPDRVLVIGDSAHHDVLGARRSGLASALVTSGIHAGELGVGFGQLPSRDSWENFARNAAAIPDFLLACFVW